MAGTHTYNTKVEHATDSGFSSALTEVTGVISISGGGLTITKTPTHHLRSTNAYKTRVAGLVDSGDRMYTCDYDEVVYAALEVIALARTSKYWRETYPDSSTLIGQGFISEFSAPEVADDDRMTYTFSVTPLSTFDFTSV